MLKAEHLVIERVTAALNLASVAVAHGIQVTPDAFITMAHFMHSYTDEFHFMKEDEILAKVLEQHGISISDGTVGNMLSEHAQCRRLIETISEAAQRWQSGDPSGSGDITWAVSTFTLLLREHIAKEQSTLFPLVEQTITAEEEQDLLAEAFMRIERRKMGPATKQKYMDMITELEGETIQWQ